MPGQIFDNESLRLIKETVRREWHRIQTEHGLPIHRYQSARQETALASGAIAAGSTAAATSASVKFMELSTDATLTAGDNVTVYNTGSSRSSTEIYPVIRDFKSHLWCVAANPTADKKPLVRFTLNAALATTDSSKAATITNQYGPGTDNSTSITVYNLADNTGSAYVFEGDSGDAGLAFWDSGTNYRIIQMECP